MTAKRVGVNQVGDRCTFGHGSGSLKTLLNIVYTTREFPQDYIPTIFDSYSMDVTCDGRQVWLGLRDHSCMEDFPGRSGLYSGCDVVMLVFSVIHPSSFENLTERWIPELKSYAP